MAEDDMIDMRGLWQIAKEESEDAAWTAWYALPALLRRIEELEASLARPAPRPGFRSQEGAA